LETDAALVNQARLGDRDAFGRLVERYERGVLAVTSGVIGRHHEARDAAQEAFLYAWRKLGQLRSPDRFAGWLMQIARRCARRAARKAARLPAPVADGQVVEVRDAPPLSDESKRMQTLLARLPAQEQVVVSLRYLDGLKVAQVAEALARPVGTVTKQLSRAHERLRRWLEESGHD